MSWWDEKAVRWQELNRFGEAEREIEFSETTVRRSIVHTREDITMVVAYLSALNRQTATIKWLLVAILVVGGYIAIRVSLHF